MELIGKLIDNLENFLVIADWVLEEHMNIGDGSTVRTGERDDAEKLCKCI